MSVKGEIGERSLRDLFHLVKQVLPETQELVPLSSETPVSKAIELMHKHNFSQVPVVEGNEVLGVFSYRSLANRLALLPEKMRGRVLELSVEEFLEDLKFARITDKLTELLDEFELMDAVLVGSEEHIQGIITTIDALRYFYNVASPYVMLREIELAIRELIRASVTQEELMNCIDKSLRKQKEGSKQPIPTCLEEMTLYEYVIILRRQDTWEKFSQAFGMNRNLVFARLEPLPDLRNDVFHFRREITVDDYEKLRDARDWLLKRITKLEARRAHQDE
jgi:CBS domain-containing protein